MARPKYTISAQDVSHATQYLKDQLRSYRIDLDEMGAYGDVERELLEAASEKQKVMRATRVNEWCESYLSTKEWNRLKFAIRKRRERLTRHNDLKTITISTQAFQLLSKLAKRDKVTYSDALEHYLPKALNSARGRVSRSR